MQRLAEVQQVRFFGELTSEAVVSQLESVFQGGDAATRIVVDCSEMTGYSAAAREEFVAWFRAHRRAISQTAIVTQNPMWHMVVRAMALASSQQMRPFGTMVEAQDWLRGGA